MRTFDFSRVCKTLLTPDIVLLLTRIHEDRARQDLFMENCADTLTRLAQSARLQSIKASNAIEGIHTSDERLQLLVKGKIAPGTSAEQEIAGYRDVLATIYESFEYIEPKPSLLLQLHRDLYRFCASSHGGHYKTCDNVIAGTDATGNQSVLFQPLPAWETPEAIERLCAAYAEALTDEELDPLLLIPVFILDFLCIHPFIDGNGRMSRLLTLLLLARAGSLVGKYASIEGLIDESRPTYYKVLQQSSRGWHTGANTYEPFVRYTLKIVSAACKEFSQRAVAAGVSQA